MPVDAHMLIALSAPRPVFITGGSADQWADPVGEFLAEVAAGPVYRLLGRKDLGVTTLPPLDTALTSGDLGWRYHTGGHAATQKTGRPSCSSSANISLHDDRAHHVRVNCAVIRERARLAHRDRVVVRAERVNGAGVEGPVERRGVIDRVEVVP